MKKKKLKLLLVSAILLFSGYIFYKNVTYRIAFTPEHEKTHQRELKRLPVDLTFAGEEVHFKTAQSYKNFYRELRYRTRNDPSTRLALRNAGLWFPVIEKILKENKLPDDLKYLALAESNLSNMTSPMQAVGFWQFTRITGIECGLIINDEIDERLDPYKSTRAACRYFKKLYGYFGRWSSVAAAYNYGETALYFAFRNQRVNSYYDLKLNRETAGYMYRIIALKDLVENPKKYGVRYTRYSQAKTKLVTITENIPDLSEYAKARGITLERLKQLNPWILKNKITVPEAPAVVTMRLPA